MLDRLDEVPWGSLHHAYGPAADVPGLLRALADPDQREGALWALYGNVFHQGTRYEATPHVVPFLVELIDAGVARVDLLDYVRHLVAGSFSLRSPGLWCDGRTLHRWDAGAVPVAEAPADLGYDQTPALLADVWRRAADALPTWLRLLDDADAAIRGRAAVLLALFADEARVADALRARLAAEPVGSVRADLCFALARVDAATVARHLADRDPVCRFVAAASALDQPGAVDVVVSGLVGVEGFDAVCARGDDPAPAVAAAALLRAAPSERIAAVPAIIAALEQAAGFDVVPLVRALFSAALPEPLHGPPVGLQREVLAALVAHPGLWTLGNLWEDFRDAGVPHDRAQVADLLGIEVPDDRALQDVEGGLTFARMGFAEQAVDHFDRAFDTDAFDAHPDGVEARIRYAEVLSERPGREADAARIWAEVAARLPDPVPALLNQAVLLGRAGERGAQVGVLTELAQARPEAEVFHHLGIALRHAERFDDALAATDRALAIDPAHRDAWWNRGSVLALLGRGDEAADAVERCVTVDPGVAGQLWHDSDFDAIREHPRFRAATGRA